MRKTYKYRLYPNKEQETKLNRTLAICRSLYNEALTERRSYYEKNKKGLSVFAQKRTLIERKEKNRYLCQAHSQVLQDVFFRLDKAYVLFFLRLKANNGKAGYPRYKATNRYHSFTYPQHGGFKLAERGLSLSKIGIVRMKLHRPLGGKPKTCTVKSEIDRWYACISCEVHPVKKSAPQRAVGIDAGLEHFVTLSNGEEIANPRCLRLSEQKLAKAQRRLSKRKKGSGNRRRQAVRVAKIHREIRDQRRDFLHKVSRNIADRFSFIAIENLAIPNMVRNRYLAKSIADAAWGQFFDYLRYKAEEAGGKVVRVDPKGTSQLCSRCGETVKKSLSVRIHKCPRCGFATSRDHNSAIEILQRAIGREPPESAPLETAIGQSLN